MIKLFVQAIEYVLVSFGFQNIHDTMDSLFGALIKTDSPSIVSLNTLLLGGIFGTLAAIVQEWIGIETSVYIALVGLFLLEFSTGVAASLFVRKEKFQSNKLGRIIVKIVIYTGLLMLFNAFKNHLGVHVLNISFNFFEWIYYIILNLLILQLLVSVFENLETLGWKEVGIFVRIFKKKINKIEEKDDKDDTTEKVA